ncbi:trypsin-like serine protease [Streptomyces uncialis]|uniref:trypsin-like serine protease n=1 Tax=Streptomyces uncialis TaxID=1048205 RepID=UPI003865E3C9|nr:trypsin-like serine protease [Streptomyces uncialis]
MTHARFGRHLRPRVLRTAAVAALSTALLAGGGTLPAHAAPADGADRPSAATRPVAQAKVPQAELRTRLAGATDAVGAEAARKAEARAKAKARTATGDGGARAAGEDARMRPFIIGGSQTTVGAAPWMVQLAYFNQGTGEGYFCGGSLVAADKVLTAAHCVDGLDWRVHGVALTGATGLYDSAAGTLAGVHRVWKHPKYRAASAQNDIAVVTLDRPVKQKWLRLAATGDTALYKPGTSATAYGWGLTSGRADGQMAAKLRKVSLPMVADGTCDRAMRNVLGRDYFVAGQMVCAGKPASGADRGTTSTCNGDSGGPLVVGGKIAGVVSWGVEGCTAKGAYPVFAKVSSYVAAAQARIDDTDLSFDGRADLLGRTSANKLYQMNSRGRSLAGRSAGAAGWQSVSWGLQVDLDRDGEQDLLYRNSRDGKLYRNYRDRAGRYTTMQVSSVGGGWKSYAVPGDLSGDGWPDLVALDASGNAYLYPGKGNGHFHAKKKVVSAAWKGAKLFGRGDLTNDGKADLLVRDKAGTVWLYRGTGKASAPFAGRIKARSNWKFTALVGNGDMTGDGIADVLARESDGKLWLYPGTGKASSSLFGTRVSLGSGFNQYNLLF